jgi:hypothetical protein
MGTMPEVTRGEGGGVLKKKVIRVFMKNYLLILRIKLREK